MSNSHVLLSAVVLVLAQASPRARAADTEPEIAGLETVTVTAQRRAEDVQRVPISISALTGDQLSDSGVTNVTAIAGEVPNMQTATPYGDAIPVFSLRGISAVDYSQNQSSPVALYVDEVYKGLPVFTSLQVFDVDRVEVLRGPQGTLYGKNTSGGAVNFYTKGASVGDGLSGYVDARLGNLNRRELAAAINVPIGDSFATRLAGQVTRVDGMVENLFPGGKDQGEIRDWAARLSTAWTPSGSLNVSLRFTASESTPTGYGVIADNIGRGGPGGLGFGTGYTREGLSFWQNDSDTTGELRIRNQSGAVTLKWDVSDAVELTSITSYDQGEWLTVEDADGSPFNIVTNTYNNRAHAWAQDLRLGSQGEGPLTWITGLYGYSDSITVAAKNQFYHAFAALDDSGTPLCFIDFFTGCTVSNQLRQDRDSLAAYAQGTYALTSRTSITAGVRYTDDRNELLYYNAWLGYLDPTTGIEIPEAVPTITAAPTDRLDSTNWSGRLGIQFQASDSAMLYASVSRGYRGGSFNGQAFFSPDEVTVAQPEELDAFEVGVKSQLLDDRVRLNAAAFYYDYKNQQFINVTPELLQIVYNAPKSRLYGAEVELTARPVQSFNVRIGASYLHANYEKAELQGQDVAGNRMILAPEWTMTAGLDWEFLHAAWGTVSAHTDSRFTSKAYYDPFNTEATAQDGYSVHDARLTAELASTPLKISAWIKNLADEEYRVYRLAVAPSFNFDYGQRGRPREYGLELRYSF